MMARRIALTRSNIPLMIASLFLYISVANGTIQYVETGNNQVRGESQPANMHPSPSLNNLEIALDVEETSQTGERPETVPVKTLRSHDTVEESTVPEEMTLSLKETVEVFHHDLEPTTAPDVLGGNLESILNGRQYLVATIDGRITLLNSDGTLIWSVLTDKSFSSSVSSLDLRDRENGRRVTLIPSLAGSIYKYDGDNLSPMPMNVESLLQRSFTLPNIPNEVTLSGGKELKTYGIDLRTGKIRYECGISGCSSPKTTEDKDASKVTLIIKKQLQTVRAVDSVSGTEKWNFSVGTNEISIAGAVCPGGFQTLLETDFNDDLIRISIPEGRVHGVDSHSNILWERELGSPISEAWLMDRGQLIPIDPILHNAAMTDPPSLYVGMLNQQFYVQESHLMKEAVSNALVSHSNDHLLAPPTLGITWKPAREACDIDDDDQSTTAITTLGTTVKPPVHFFVYESDRIDIDASDNRSDSILTVPDSGPFEEFQDDDLDFDSSDLDEITNVDAVIKSVWHWWKEILGLSLFITVIFNIMFLRPIIRFVRTDTVREMMRSFNIWLESQRGVVEEAAEAMPYENALVPYSGGGGGDRCTSSSSTSVDNDLTPRQKKDSFTEFEETEPVYPFISTYLKEFEPIQCLGKGAFGIVFEAKKKIDDRNYAVKRIALPNRENDRARVMREVKALAQLDHKNIVRYFHAWVENPPKGWLENHDPLWNSNVVNSALPTCDWSSSSYSVSVPNKQLTSVTFSTDSFVSSLRNRRNDFNKSMEDDSFIVFEASNTDLKSKPSEDESVDAYSRLNESICDTDAKSENVDSNESGVMYLYIQQELCHKRTLQHWLKMEQKRDKIQVMKFFSEIVDAVEYVHAKKLIHRDLKPGNIFLSGSHEGLGEINVKIGDFGLVTSADVPFESQVDGSSLHKTAESPLLAKKSKTHFTDNVGTYLYMSPEQSKRKPYDYKVDIFSLGLIFYELLVPFSTDMERYDVLSKVKSLQFSRNFEELFSEEKSMIEEMISHNPEKRPDATAIKEWIRFQMNLPKLPKNKSRKARNFSSRKDS